ncbi:hypothetical protein FQA39_LY05619 [Lamprigera yunnana]|nr:hypothetical protein FQA39_LY05619 [Lamprigera yunnana]
MVENNKMLSQMVQNNNSTVVLVILIDLPYSTMKALHDQILLSVVAIMKILLGAIGSYTYSHKRPESRSELEELKMKIEPLKRELEKIKKENDHLNTLTGDYKRKS